MSSPPVAPPTRNVPTPTRSFAKLLDANKDQIVNALPKKSDLERFVRICLTETRKNPELASCDELSFLGAVIQCAQLGLEPGSGLGYVYLIPFMNRRRGIKEVQVVPGYRGLIELARRSGEILSITARLVRERDIFVFHAGDDERIEHRVWIGQEDPGTITHVYAIAKLKDGGVQREVMSRAQIDAVRAQLKNPNPVWESNFDEMARKTVLKRLCKMLPLSPQLVEALDTDNQDWSSLGLVNTLPPLKRVHNQAQIADAWDTTPMLDGPSDRDIAVQEFDDAVSIFRGDLGTLLGAPVEQARATWPINQLLNAVDRMKNVP